MFGRRSTTVAELAPSEHPRTIGALGAWALAMGGSNQSLFLIGALMLSQGTAAVPLLIVGLLLAWAATPGWIELVLMWPKRVGGISATCAEAFRPYSPVLANLTGTCYWWGWVPTCGLTAILAASALHQWYLPFVPVPLLATLVVLAVAAVNLMGVKWTTRVAIPIVMQEEVGRAAVALDGAREGLRAAESALKRNVGQQAAVAREGQSALESRDRGELLAQVSRTLRDVLGVHAGGLVSYDAARLPVLLTDDGRHRLGARLSTPIAVDASETVPEPLMVEAWNGHGQADVPAPLRAFAAVSGICIPVHADDALFGALCVYETVPRDFRPDEVDFVRVLASVLVDAIARSRTEEVRHRAMHDPLTELPNRNLFVDRLDHALAACERSGLTVAVLFLDLDQFKLVNDSLDHSAGDQLLRDVGARLAGSLRPGDTVARFGGDEFLVICARLESVTQAMALAERTIAALARPFVLNGVQHGVRGSIGIAVAEGQRRASADLVREADAAMYRAKERGRGGFEVYDDVMRARATDRLRIENELRRALSDHELRVHYQPSSASRAAAW